ncbi:Galactose mutarotase [Lachnospiraceae bacterium KH1T2]|nr:Galactose mutarotase [Lachnospiraceae bacterium KH1T2]
MRYTISNEKLTAEIESFGAELKSLKKGDREYMWCADPKFWNRTSPVLFPFVGALNEGVYRTKGKEYKMGQHGFARDNEFELVEQKSDEITFAFKSNEETLARYPYEFELRIAYKLEGSSIKVNWKVVNPGNETMYFAIGAHPAFNITLDEQGTQNGTYVKFDTNKELEMRKFEDPVALDEKHYMQPDKDGYIALNEHSFDNGVFIVENDQAHEVSLAGVDKKPFVTLKFDAPLFGVWSPVKKNAPFVCIEPWYGRADVKGYSGELKDREFEQSVEAGKIFEKEYSITVD